MSPLQALFRGRALRPDVDHTVWGEPPPMFFRGQDPALLYVTVPGFSTVWYWSLRAPDNWGTSREWQRTPEGELLHREGRTPTPLPIQPAVPEGVRQRIQRLGVWL